MSPCNVVCNGFITCCISLGTGLLTAVLSQQLFNDKGGGKTASHCFRKYISFAKKEYFHEAGRKENQTRWRKEHVGMKKINPRNSFAGASHNSVQARPGPSIFVGLK